MSVSGVGSAGTSWQPVGDDSGAPAPGSPGDPAVGALLSELREATGDSSLPGWLVDWIDGSDNVKKLIDGTLSDGQVTAAEVKSLVGGASDWDAISSSEKEVLTKLLQGNAAKFEPAAREAFAQWLGIANPLPVATSPTGPAGPTGPTAPTTPVEPTGPKAADLVPARFLEKHGLDPSRLETASVYEGHEWDVGYYPYSGDVQYEAFGKFNSVFGKGGEDGHAYFEHYSNPPSGLETGSWIKGGHIREDDFEMTAGVDVTGDRPISNELYKAIRESGAPARAELAVLDASGKQVPFEAGARLVPTVMENGKPIETDDRSGRNVVWRVKGKDGKIDDSAVAKSRDDVMGLKGGVKFDFLDATGGMVPFRPDSGDKIAESFKADDGKWHAFAKQDDGRYKHTVLDGDRIVSTATIDAAAKGELTSGKDVIHRVQSSGGQLKGDGKVGEDYNMGWWGKCHNVASLSTSNFPRPKETVRIVSNLGAGETLALQAGGTVVRPKDDGSFVKETRDASGAVTASGPMTAAEAAEWQKSASAEAVIVKGDGSLKPAEYETFTPTDVDALTSHVGDGAVESKGGEGQRYYAHPDILVTKDGRQIQAHILEVKTASGKSEKIGSRNGYDFEETSRAALRAPGMDSRVLNNGGRSMAFNVQDVEGLNKFREDDITELKVVHPDGREETIKASDLDLVAWENKFDFAPDDLWALHGTVNGDGSTVAETYSGTQVWNYAVRNVATQPLDPKTLTESEKAEAAKPGMKAGTIEEEGKHFFSTTMKTDGGEKDVKYWVRFDDEGEVTDYGYLGEPHGQVLDFTWTQHAKDPYATRWTGESQAPGISNAEIQRIYLASQGALGGASLPGGFISKQDLMSAKAERPE